jgi:Ca2+-binding RTX toxin-like protein
MSRAYRFFLEGAQQVPGVISSASGFGTAVFDSVTNTLTYTMTVTGLDWGAFLGQAAETAPVSDNVTDAHFHTGARGANGGVILPWKTGDVDDFAVSAPAGGTRMISGVWEMTDAPSISAFIAQLNSGVLGADIGIYANIHTVANGGGELRGQLVTIATDAGETVSGTAGADLLPGLGGDDIIIGGLGNDTLRGDAGDDRLYGSEGNDTIDTGAPGAGAFEYAYGGDGDDIINATGSSQLVAYDDGFNYSGVASTVDGNDTIDLSGADVRPEYLNSTFGYVYGGGGADSITGSGRPDYLYGGNGTDVITGGDGDDVVDGGAGNDDLNGGLGRDNIYGGTGDDTLRSGGSQIFGLLERMYGGDGSDTIYATASGYFNIWGDDLNNAVDPGTLPGDDIIDVSAAGLNSGFTINIWAGGGADTVTGSGGTENIYGEGGTDNLEGGDGDDFIYGGQGNDTLYGAGGVDRIYGETEADTIYGGADADLIYGGYGSGIDTIDGGSGADYIEAAHGADTIYGGLDGDTIYSGGDSDFLYGGDGNDLLYGEHGADSFYGGAGVDVLFIDSTDAVYDGGADRDYLVWQDVSVAANVNLAAHSLDYAYGYTGADIFYATGATTRVELHGGGGNDILVGGGSGGSILLGEGDNDRLVSEIGIDHMVGGSGADTFVFSANGATDYVYDFTSGTDKADFTALAGAGIHSLANLTIITAYSGAGWYGYNYGSGIAWLNTTAAGGGQPVAGDFLFA